MPIQLQTPFNIGAADPNSPYSQVKILEFTLRPTLHQIRLLTQYGNTVGGVWVSGVGVSNITVREYVINDGDYSTMVASASAGAGEVYYDKVSGLLYQWLLDQGHYAGTIV